MSTTPRPAPGEHAGEHRENVLVESCRDGELTHIRLADGDRDNALGPAMVRALRAALARADGAAIVLTAEGRNFCAGGDHRELGALSRQEFRSYLAELIGLFADVASAPVPVVAGVHRAVVGGGLELALLCDLIVAADDAWFHLPQIRLGGRIGTHTYRMLIARIGLGMTRRLAHLGTRLDAAAAHACGLVDVLVPRDGLDAEAEAHARTLAGLPPGALRRSRETLRDIVGVADMLAAEAARRTQTVPRPNDA